MRKACLDEEWFIEDMIEAIDKMAAEEKLFITTSLKSFDENIEKALSQVYKLSRAIRIRRLLAGDFEGARNTGNDEALNFMNFIQFLTKVALVGYIEQGVSDA